MYGTDGYLLVENINNPQKITVFDGHNRPVRELPCPPQLTGYEYELLETVRCLEQGLVECPSMPHAETVHMMEVMDHLRAQMGIVYPAKRWTHNLTSQQSTPAPRYRGAGVLFLLLWIHSSSKATATSLTLVPVGPVISSPSTARRAW